jgi:DNA polymerase-3 subunit epsilon
MLHSTFLSAGPAGLLDREIAATPIAVVDFETTGLYAGEDRVVEVAVVRIEPGGRPEVVLDTLVHPRRRVGATWGTAWAPRSCLPS